ncbi:MAG: hypothetical protein MUO59_05315 [Actinobacteria bacterium]|nr:hypothetical protein [Actinomycetota bacterium]
MKSDDKKIDIVYKKLMAKKSGQEKILMGFSMFGFSSRFLLNSFKDKIPPKELKKSVFLRLYKNDFDRYQQNKILKYL